MERILFSNAFNQTEYLRTLAKLGFNTFGLRVMNDAELCSYILEHGQKIPDGSFISSKEEDYIYYHLSGGDYNDAKNLRSAIDSYRDSIESNVLDSLENNLSNDFLDKKNLIKNKYQEYEQYKKDHRLYDKNDLINYVLSSGIKLDIECSYYDEYGISQVFLKTLKAIFSNVKAVSLNDTFVKKDKDIHFMKAYGKPCEADYVFSEIQKYPLDECQIVVTNSEDVLEIASTAEMLNIPYTSHLGQPIIASKAGILLSYLFKLEDMQYGVDGYRNLFECTAFNKQSFIDLIPPTVKKTDRVFNDFIKYAGWLRLGFDKTQSVPTHLYKKEIAEMLLKLQDSLSKGRAAFIKEYLVDITPLDETVISSIETVEKAAQQFDFDYNNVLRDLLNGRVDKRIAKSGHLYISDINSAISALRKHVFIIGLDSSFPGGPKENYLLFDEEYAKTGSDFYDSKEIVKRKEKVLRALINAGEDVYLTYPYFELASLEDNNPSSIVFDLYPKDIAKEPIPSYGFNDLQLAVNKEVYQARLDNKLSNISVNKPVVLYNKQPLLDKQYSPSSFHCFFEEDNRLQFLLSAILGIDIKDEDDPYRIISTNERGTIIHALMEGFQKDKVSWPNFLKEAETKFDELLLMKPAVIPLSIAKERNEYLRIIKNLYDDDPGNIFVAAEEYVSGAIHDIKFGGLFDRIEKDKNNKYILVDYKTGSKVIHIPEDTVSCIQGLIYAYLINNNASYQKRGIVIDRIEFRYPDSRDIIPIHYSSIKEKEFLDCIDEFKAAIESGELFIHLDPKEFASQNYLDKYTHLVSLMKGVKSL